MSMHLAVSGSQVVSWMECLNAPIRYVARGAHHLVAVCVERDGSWQEGCIFRSCGVPGTHSRCRARNEPKQKLEEV